jgi:hypothetical protein
VGLAGVKALTQFISFRATRKMTARKPSCGAAYVGLLLVTGEAPAHPTEVVVLYVLSDYTFAPCVTPLPFYFKL